MSFFSIVRALLLFLFLRSQSLGASSVGSSCDEKDESCANEPPIFDVFAKWIEDRSVEGQNIIEKILGPADGEGRSGKESKSTFFDEIKDAVASSASADEESIESQIWRGVTAVKDEINDSIAKFVNEFNIGKEPKKGNGACGNEGFDFVKAFQKAFFASNKDQNTEESREMAVDFIQKASELTRYLQSGKAKRGFLELHDAMMKALGEVTESVWRNFGHIDWHRLKPFSIAYFVEHMETLITPSWKRRAHAFAPTVSANEVKELHKALYLTNLAYLDTVEEIKQGLKQESSEWELIYAQLKNAPGEPAHYIALRKEPLLHSMVRQDSLDVLLVIRGTKDFSDVLSDGLLDAVEFRGGLGHAGLVQSGKFIVDHHIDLLHSLLKMAKKEKIKLTLLGHSLGAGAAAIAAIIFNEDQKAIDANVIGFGCPALLSEELSKAATPYITTIISDADMIPRLSGPTLINAVFDVMSYDWIEKGLTDLRSGLEFIRTNMPFDIPVEHVESVYKYIKQFLDDNIKIEIEEMAKATREDVVLMPPGNCIHFYRDGVSVTGKKISCEFFDSLEISRTMLDDHLVGIGYNRMLLDYMRHHLEDYQFVFDQNIV
eukprot:CAMPEP_0183705544 /NCGR_PEP_ID=MMETSP0737-20130205/2589_1 /TAXON_ID=385413 /ORGANISM="Thalassiosira miniscula, Strain CCMP1093" /LENGTH=602 /DNA_ID=CAMNT_0025932701 /DNA_START=144 /DNA_END=1952 /DNA_ORIENTATION=+